MSGKQQKLAEGEQGRRLGEEHAKSELREQLRLVLMGVAALLSWIGAWHVFLPIDFVAILATLVGGYPVYKETFGALRYGHVNMEVSMTVAIFASLAVGQYTVSVVITFFVLLSEYIETYAVDRGRQTITLLEKSTPKRALVRRNGIETEVDTISATERYRDCESWRAYTRGRNDCCWVCICKPVSYDWRIS